MTIKYTSESLINFATELFVRSGMRRDIADETAHVLVQGDLLGHDTHGLQLLPMYLGSLEKGGMLADGDIQILQQRSAVASWDGQYLSGPWLVRRALDWAQPAAREHGSATVVIRRSHHIAALAAYLEQPAREGFLVQLLCSDPSVVSVAPYGGCEPVVTPNPMAWGIPASKDPVMIDISASITTNGMTGRLHGSRQKGEHAWWIDADGQATNDPSVLFTDPPGSLLPLGGLEAGHKGFSLALFVEAMTALSLIHI